jgi:membrane protein DedA with SNARE-associated domain
MVESLLTWLESLPLWALYGTMGLLAIIENIFPPIPADTIVALGSFLAARGQGSATAAFAVTWVGNVAGAMMMYAAGRRYGAGFLERWMKKSRGKEEYEDKLERLYIKYGLAALAASRLLPGVRALVPPFAGAMRLPFPSVLVVVALPSGIWYGIVTYVAFQMGSNLESAISSVEATQNWTTIVGGIVLAAALVFWFVHRRRSRMRRGGDEQG